MSPATVTHTCFGHISANRLEEIAEYSQEDITVKNFRDARVNSVTWLTLKDILLYHPDSVVRHEVPFVAAELGLAADILPWLMKVIKFDNSIICKHEAVEAIGRIKGRDAREAYRFLQTTTEHGRYDPDVYHPDVQATVREAVRSLQQEILQL